MSHLIPTASYQSPSEPQKVVFRPGEGPHSTDGKSTRISELVIKAGGEDRDKPTEARDTNLGSLRAQLTSLQDQLNEFLTRKMQNKSKLNNTDDDLEKRILDDGIDEESD